MNQTDLIIVAVYLICVAYVIRQAWDSLEDRTKIEFDAAAYKTQLETPQGDITPNNYVEVEFEIKPTQRFEFSKQPKKLTTTIKNKSRTSTLLVDWDRSVLTNYENTARRVIRLSSSLEDIPESQPPSSIRPGQNIKEDLATDKMLKVDKEKQSVELDKPIVDLEELQTEAHKEGPFTTERQALRAERLADMYYSFLYRTKPLEFSLSLQFQVEEIKAGERKRYWFYLPFKFTVSRAYRKEYIPWNPKPFRRQYYPTRTRRRFYR